MDKNIIFKVNAGLAGIVLALCVFLGGCETVKGIGTGIVCTGQGIGKDSYNFYESIGKADQWVRENLW